MGNKFLNSRGKINGEFKNSDENLPENIGQARCNFVRINQYHSDQFSNFKAKVTLFRDNKMIENWNVKITSSLDETFGYVAMKRTRLEFTQRVVMSKNDG